MNIEIRNLSTMTFEEPDVLILVEIPIPEGIVEIVPRRANRGIRATVDKLDVLHSILLRIQHLTALPLLAVKHTHGIIIRSRNEVLP